MADRKKTALISVWNKNGLEKFASGLSLLGWRIYASGGTAGTIRESGIEVTPTEASAITATVAPTIELGSITVTPVIAIAYTSTVRPDVQGGEQAGLRSRLSISIK